MPPTPPACCVMCDDNTMTTTTSTSSSSASPSNANTSNVVVAFPGSTPPHPQLVTAPHSLGLQRCASFHFPISLSTTGRFEPPIWSTPSGNPADNSNIAIHIIKNGDVVKTVKFSDGRRYTLFGRSPMAAKENDGGVIERLEHPTVSRTHAAIIHSSGGSLFLVDLGSSHGTHVSGSRVIPFEVVPLRDRAVVLFGASTRKYIVRVFPSLTAGNMAPPLAPHFASVAGTPPTGGTCDMDDMDDSTEVLTHTRMNCVPDFAPVNVPRSPNRLLRRVSFSCMAPEVIPCPDSRPTSPLLQPSRYHHHHQLHESQPAIMPGSDDSESSTDSFSPVLVHMKRAQPSSPSAVHLVSSSSSSSPPSHLSSKRFCSGSM